MRGVSAAFLALAGLAGPAAAGPALDEGIAALSGEIDPDARRALAAIEGEGRRLLALRGYLRAGPLLAERWSWSDAEAAAWASSPDRRDLDAAIAGVRCAFEAANPGYTLYVNTNFRSLDLQIARWNENRSVGLAGDDLLAHVERALAAHPPGDAATPAGARDLKRLLLEYRPTPAPTLAVPGLSPHGRMRAVDFQVMADEQLVAGTDSEAVEAAWKAGGWEQRLRAAVVRAGTAFAGPLENPVEPWHYDFLPDEEPSGAAPGVDCAAGR